MNSVRFIFCLVVFFIFTSVTELYSQKVDYGLIANVTLRKQVSRFEFMVQQNVWFASDASKFARYMPITGIDYYIWKKNLKLDVQYFYIHKYSESRKVTNLHRYQAGATGYYSLSGVNMSLYSRFESTHTKGKPGMTNKWRNWFTFSYSHIKDWVVRPYVSIDFFNMLNRCSRPMELDQIWYATGLEYRLNRSNIIDFRLRAHHVTRFDPHTLDCMFGVFYKIRL